MTSLFVFSGPILSSPRSSSRVKSMSSCVMIPVLSSWVRSRLDTATGSNGRSSPRSGANPSDHTFSRGCSTWMDFVHPVNWSFSTSTVGRSNGVSIVCACHQRGLRLLTIVRSPGTGLVLSIPGISNSTSPWSREPSPREIMNRSTREHLLTGLIDLAASRRVASKPGMLESRLAIPCVTAALSDPGASATRLEPHEWVLIDNRFQSIDYPRPDLWEELWRPVILAELSWLLRYVAYLYYTLGEGQVRIARRLGMSRWAVSDHVVELRNCLTALDPQSPRLHADHPDGGDPDVPSQEAPLAE